jgi:hypothetical protein
MGGARRNGRPLGAPAATVIHQRQIDEFYASARAAGRYDFQCGHRLAGAAERATGLTIIHEGTLPDDELSFQGQHQPTCSKHGGFDYNAWLSSKHSSDRVFLSLKEPFSALWHRRIIDHRRGSSSLLRSVPQE